LPEVAAASSRDERMRPSTPGADRRGAEHGAYLRRRLIDRPDLANDIDGLATDLDIYRWHSPTPPPTCSTKTWNSALPPGLAAWRAAVGPRPALERAMRHAGRMIPADLTPRWRDLPALAWLAAGAFRAQTPPWRPLAGLARVAAWPAFVAALVGAHVERELAAHDRGAMVILVDRASRRRRWRGVTASLATLPIMGGVLVLPALAVAVVGVIVNVLGAPRLGVVIMWLAPAAILAPAGLAAAAIAVALRTEIRHSRTTARQWALTQHARLVEATTLAADPADGRAATVLLRRLLRAADQHQVAVVVYARDDRLVELYTRLRFGPVPPVPGRALYRPLRHRDQPSSAFG
jgi:hypothetical protein